MLPPFRFHCFKCETSGVLNSQTFRDLGIYDTNLNINVINANKEQLNNLKEQKVSFKKKALLNTCVDSLPTQNALFYLNKRFETNFTAEYAASQFKCILDPQHFFNINRINPKINNFDFTNAIGFMSSDSSHLIFRDYGGLQNKRYNNFSICPDINSASKTYNISGEISAMAPEITLVIAEGIFDIIGIYTHFGNLYDKSSTIFAAACGKAFNAVILNYIRMGFLNLNVVIYSDADVKLEFYKNLKNNSPYLKNSKIQIFYNSLFNPETKFGKDYGVPKNQIKLKQIII